MAAARLVSVHDDLTRRTALAALARGESLSTVSRSVGVARSTLRAWVAEPEPDRRGTCPRCRDGVLDHVSYAALLGYYLGDGCISRVSRAYTLRVTCDVRYPGIIEDVADLLRTVNPARPVHRVSAPGCVVVQSAWAHWPCLFPQHGPGRKHERPIVLDGWQHQAVEAHPGAFLRGLFHSDGCRTRNWARQTVAGRPKRYNYPRWQFVNASADIRELACWALDLIDVAWRQSNARTISVSRRAAVERLDTLIGPKT